MPDIEAGQTVVPPRPGMLSRARAGDKAGLVELGCRDARWNEQISAWCQDFHGRV